MIHKQMEAGEKKGLIRVSKDGERAFFFYATIGMVILWSVTRFWGG